MKLIPLITIERHGGHFVREVAIRCTAGEYYLALDGALYRQSDGQTAANEREYIALADRAALREHFGGKE